MLKTFLFSNYLEKSSKSIFKFLFFSVIAGFFPSKLKGRPMPPLTSSRGGGGKNLRGVQGAPTLLNRVYLFFGGEVCAK